MVPPMVGALGGECHCFGEVLEGPKGTRTHQADCGMLNIFDISSTAVCELNIVKPFWVET